MMKGRSGLLEQHSKAELSVGLRHVRTKVEEKE